MTLDQFTKWMRNNLCEEKMFKTVGKRSQFCALYELQSKAIKITISKGKNWIINKDDLQKIFNRFMEAPQSMKHRAVYYTDPEWRETPNRIFAPYLPAIIRYCIENNEAIP